ncbi:MAG: homoserine dehydrogenase [Butyrivibrio sp.]
MVNIAVLGYGTVGSGVVEVLRTNRKAINNRAGQEINLKYVLDLRDFPGDPVEEVLVHDFDTILNDDDVKIVVEVMGGVNPAYQFVKSALLKGKSACTSNKELVAKHGAELIQIARDNNVNFLFEASVGGGIPIIRPLNQSLTADEIVEISGILNGTTNYILTKMSQEGLDFDTVLREAQKLGYAERNPEADVEGYDACRKIAILSSLACGHQVDFEDIYTEGITRITERDFRYADALGVKIKLIGTGKKVGDGVCAMVAPKMIDNEHPLAGVNGVMNAIFVKGNVLGDVMFYGAGAGKLPTASAVVSDVVDAVKHMGTNIMTIWSQEKQKLVDMKDAKTRFFIRVKGSADEGLDEIKALFGNGQVISIPGYDDEFGFVTEEITEGAYAAGAAECDKIITRIRYEK